VRALEIPSETRHLAYVRSFVTDALRGTPIPQSVVNQVVLAVDEAVSNAIEHAYGEDRDGPITIEVAVERAEVRVTITDRGVRFEGVATPPELDIEQHVRLGRRKGLGLFLIHKIMDEVRYATEGGRNALTLVKRFKEEAPEGGA